MMTGVKDTAVVDYVSAENNKIKVVMVEDREWDSSDQMYVELQDKLTNYLVFIESGQLDTMYPDFKSAEKIIRLDFMYPTTEYAELVVDKIRKLLSSKNIGFETSILKK
ncbi:DUF6572 domain-containing protein [Vibrio bivalvicida]|uniref:DUF6572 domain-containing protein n=1 Tax=Vibrio bivalvicida TaxID=1276888 RepID=A0ABV4MGB3_9VIBR